MVIRQHGTYYSLYMKQTFLICQYLILKKSRISVSRNYVHDPINLVQIAFCQQSLNQCRVCSSYVFLFFEQIPIFSYFLNETSCFCLQSSMCYKIKNGFKLRCFRCRFSIKQLRSWLWCSKSTKMLVRVIINSLFSAAY